MMANFFRLFEVSKIVFIQKQPFRHDLLTSILKRNSAHETPGLIEIFKLKFFENSVSALNQGSKYHIFPKKHKKLYFLIRWIRFGTLTSTVSQPVSVKAVRPASSMGLAAILLNYSLSKSRKYLLENLKISRLPCTEAS